MSGTTKEYNEEEEAVMPDLLDYWEGKASDRIWDSMDCGG